MVKHWVAVASHEHVKKAIAGGFAQVCHGKVGPLNKMNKDDWILYYSPTVKFQEKEPCRKFTAIGRILGDAPYEFEMTKDFVPWRIDVCFLRAKDIEITPLIDDLSFIKDKKRWGFPFRRGCFSIPEKDFSLIAAHMGIHDS